MLLVASFQSSLCIWSKQTIVTPFHQGAYSVVLDGTSEKLIPNDAPVLKDLETPFPAFQAVASQCSTLSPTQSAQYFSGKQLTILHINARSLHQSFTDICLFVGNGQHKADFMLISETWLDPALLNSYQIPGYEMIHSIPDRQFTGKGCAIYISDHFYPYCQVLQTLGACQLEYQSLLVRVNFPNKTPFIVGTFYRSPSYSVNDFMPYFEATLSSLCNLSKPTFLAGDYNVNLFNYNTKVEVKHFLDCLNSYGFLPAITVPTRIANTHPFTATLIDNIFSNTLEHVVCSGAISAGIADHQAIFLASDLISLQATKPCREFKPRFNFNRIEQLKCNLTQKLIGFNEMNDPEVCAERLIDTINAEVSNLSSMAYSRKHTPIQPWVTSAILRSLHIRSILLKTFLKNRTEENQLKFKRYRNALRLVIRQAKRLYYKTQFMKNADQPRKLWDNLLEAIQKKKKTSSLPPRFDVDGAAIDDPHVIASLFNKYYSQVAPKLDESLGPSNTDPLSFMPNLDIPDTMTFQPVSEEYIALVICELKDAAAGLDGISTKLLKGILPAILPQVTHLMNLCLATNTFPSKFKTAVITPIYKSGSPTLFSNYRPISVLPVLSKILERIMYNQLLTFVHEQNILYDKQFGFRSKHSTYMPLVLLYDQITANLADGRKAAGIYLDLARAFDTVNIKILLKKMEKYGFRDGALEMLTSYLTDRSHQLKYNNVISSPERVTCGVPQGSVLGPLLFLLYIDDLHSVCDQANVMLFADDTCAAYFADNWDDLQRIISLSFPKITHWLHANRLSLSIPKTFYQVYGVNANEHDLLIAVNGNNLKRAKTVKYLGILVDEDLKFKSHVNKVSGVISRNNGIISRAKYLLDKKLLLMLHHALVQPLMMYCSVVWGSNYDTTLHPIVIQQKRAIRLIFGLPFGSHTSPLFKELKLLKLQDLIKSQMLLILHDALFARIPSIIADKFIICPQEPRPRIARHFSEVMVNSRGNPTPNYRRLNYRLFSLFCMAPKIWNTYIASRIPNLNDIPPSKPLFKKCVKLIFTDLY